MKRNSNVSSVAITREERQQIGKLFVRTLLLKKTGHGNQTSLAWCHFRLLCYAQAISECSASEPKVKLKDSENIIDKENYWCRLCLLDEQKKYKDRKSGHISSLKKYGIKTSTSLIISVKIMDYSRFSILQVGSPIQMYMHLMMKMKLTTNLIVVLVALMMLIIPYLKRIKA